LPQLPVKVRQMPSQAGGAGRIAGMTEHSSVLSQQLNVAAPALFGSGSLLSPVSERAALLP